MIVSTRIRIQEGREARFFDLHEVPRDSLCGNDYVEGSIVIEIDGRAWTGEDLWDDIAWLWQFILEGLESLANGAGFHCCFPDQPVEMAFVEDGPVVYLRINERSVALPRDAFVQTFAKAARRFFEWEGSPGARDRIRAFLQERGKATAGAAQEANHARPAR